MLQIVTKSINVTLNKLSKGEDEITISPQLLKDIEAVVQEMVDSSFADEHILVEVECLN